MEAAAVAVEEAVIDSRMIRRRRRRRGVKGDSAETHRSLVAVASNPTNFT